MFTWDPAKAASNLTKHGVSFEEAETVFGDYFSQTAADPDHSDTEVREIVFGFSVKQRLLAVVFTDDEERIRIISARLATRIERAIYDGQR